MRSAGRSWPPGSPRRAAGSGPPRSRSCPSDTSRCAPRAPSRRQGTPRRPASAAARRPRPHRCARWISSDSWSRIADSTGRSRNSSGWRQKNWSSASAPATYSARPVPRRPARPHIWRRLATVPGEGHADRRVQAADVDAQLQRVGGHHGQQLARPPAAARSRAAARACSRRGRARSARPGRRGRGPPAAGARSAGSAPRRGASAGSRSCAPPSPPGRPAGRRPPPSGEPRAPVRSSTSGGFHMAIRRSARGAPSRSTSATSQPVSRSASSTGLAIVALASTNRGSVP